MLDNHSSKIAPPPGCQVIVNQLVRSIGDCDQSVWEFASPTFPPLWVIRFRNTPERGLNTFITIGLSEFPQTGLEECPDPSHVFGQELMLISNRWHGRGRAPNLLAGICHDALERKIGYRSGNIIRLKNLTFSQLRRPTVRRRQLDSFYVTEPPDFYRDVLKLDALDGTARSLFWLMPVTDLEVEYIKTYGVLAFEKLCAESEAEFGNFWRESLC